MDEFTKMIKDNSIGVLIIAILFIVLYFTKQGEPEIISINPDSGQEIKGYSECTDDCELLKFENKILSVTKIINSSRITNSIRCCRTINYLVDGVLKQREKCRDFEENTCRTNWYLDD